MRISSYETLAVRIWREPGPTAPRDEADFVTLRLRTDDGIEGIAYAGFASKLVTRALKELLDALASETVGADPHAVEAIGRGLLHEAGDASPAGLVTRAVSAIDVALWDIRGKALGMPVWKLLGAGSGVLPTYASGYLWRHFDLDELAAAAEGARREGVSGHEAPHGWGADRRGRAGAAADDARGRRR